MLKNILWTNELSTEGEFGESISSFFLCFFLLPINIALLVPPVLPLTAP